MVWKRRGDERRGDADGLRFRLSSRQILDPLPKLFSRRKSWRRDALDGRRLESSSSFALSSSFLLLLLLLLFPLSPFTSSPRHRLLVIAATNTNFVVIIRSRPRLKEAERKKPCVYPLQNPLERRSSCHRERQIFSFLSVPLARASARACVCIIFINEPSLSHFPRYPWNRICLKWRSFQIYIHTYILFSPFRFFGSRDRTRVETFRRIRRS